MLQTAIEHGMTVLGWYENLMKDEVPPEYLWEDPKGLELWWADVTEKREERFGGGSSSTRDDDDDSAPELVENDLARAFRDR